MQADAPALVAVIGIRRRKEVTQQLDELAVSKDDRVRIEAAVEAKVPRLTRREYNEWLIRRDRLGMDFGEPPSFRVCGAPAQR